MAKQKKPGPAKKPEALKQTSKEFRLVSRDLLAEAVAILRAASSTPTITRVR